MPSSHDGKRSGGAEHVTKFAMVLKTRMIFGQRLNRQFYYLFSSAAFVWAFLKARLFSGNQHLAQVYPKAKNDSVLCGINIFEFSQRAQRIVDTGDPGANNAAHGKGIQRANNTTHEGNFIANKKLPQQRQMGSKDYLTLSINVSTQ
jgi:hypothetical protein